MKRFYRVARARAREEEVSFSAGNLNLYGFKKLLSPDETAILRRLLFDLANFAHRFPRRDVLPGQRKCRLVQSIILTRY